MREAVIVSAVRTTLGRANRGTLADVRPEEMASTVIKEVLNRAEPVKPEDVEDVIMGFSFPGGEQGLNAARNVLLRAGLPDSVPGQTVNRFCSSGLQMIAMATDKGLTIKTKEGVRQTLEADTIVTALPLLPNTELSKSLAGSAPEVYAIGDCREPHLIVDAIADGTRKTRAI